MVLSHLQLTLKPHNPHFSLHERGIEVEFYYEIEPADSESEIAGKKSAPVSSFPSLTFNKRKTPWEKFSPERKGEAKNIMNAFKV